MPFIHRIAVETFELRGRTIRKGDLVFLGLANNAFLNTSSSLFIMKIQGTIVDLLVAPLGPGELLLGFVGGGMVRGLVVGLLTWAVALVFAGFQLAHPLVTLAFLLGTAYVFSVLGLVAAVWAEKFEQINFFPTFVMLPLTFLGGVFYSISRLPEPWRTLSHFNPMVYMVEGLRYGMLGHSAFPPLLGTGILLGLAVVATGEPVYRERPLPGAILTRVAASHLRVGTFEFFSAHSGLEQVRQLAAERERQHLARELHDSVTQTIFSMTLTTQSALLLLDRDRQQVAGQLHRLNQLVQSALADIQMLVSELASDARAGSGFVANLQQHLADRQRLDNLCVTLKIEGNQALRAEEEAGLFRIAQEALNNIIKHAGVSQATLRLHLVDPFWMEIEDGGTGFDSQQARGGGRVGLTGMSERAAEIGWIFWVESCPGQGTRIRVEKPSKGT